MAIVENEKKLKSYDVRGKFGFSQDYGNALYGYTRFGEQNDSAGCYQRKRTAQGYKLFKQRIYFPTNPRTVPQQAWRAIFTSAMTAWTSLSPTDKSSWKRRAKAYHIHGHNLFLRYFLNSA